MSIMLRLEDLEQLWKAVNKCVTASGGRSDCTSTERQEAVVEVEKAVLAIAGRHVFDEMKKAEELFRAVEERCRDAFEDRAGYSVEHYTVPVCPLCGAEGAEDCRENCPRPAIAAWIAHIGHAEELVRRKTPPFPRFASIEHYRGNRLDHIEVLDWQAKKTHIRGLHHRAAVMAEVKHRVYEDSDEECRWRAGMVTEALEIAAEAPCRCPDGRPSEVGPCAPCQLRAARRGA